MAFTADVCPTANGYGGTKFVFGKRKVFQTPDNNRTAGNDNRPDGAGNSFRRAEKSKR